MLYFHVHGSPVSRVTMRSDFIPLPGIYALGISNYTETCFRLHDSVLILYFMNFFSFLMAYVQCKFRKWPCVFWCPLRLTLGYECLFSEHMAEEDITFTGTCFEHVCNWIVLRALMFAYLTKVMCWSVQEFKYLTDHRHRFRQNVGI